jgi:hypothetical protein
MNTHPVAEMFPILSATELAEMADDILAIEAAGVYCALLRGGARPDIQRLERLVLVALADYMNRDGHAYPSVETLARAAACSPRHARGCLASLMRRGVIEPVGERSGGGRGRTTRWRFTLEINNPPDSVP